MSENEVLAAVSRERDNQRFKFGELDEINSAGDFLCYMKRYWNQAVDNNNPSAIGYTMGAIRKMTALGVAAMEKFGTGE